jgi:molybdopterin/thiamine biosynthesis adenylyltransferase/rhodanese-related sulfurtransferase
MLSQEELIRYSRHLVMPGFDQQGQQKLKDASVLVIGAGGLGSPVLQYLTAAGIGRIGIVDYDVVDFSNLQRQVLFETDDVGFPKAQLAKAKLERQNPNVIFEVYQTSLNRDNILDILKDYDVVADGTDNFPTRYLINDACVIAGKPLVYGSIHQYEGQVSVFNYENGPNYRDLYPVPPDPNTVPSCEEGGVLGSLPGTIGSAMATEVIKVITGIGKTLSGRLFLFNALEFTTDIIKLPPAHIDHQIKELIDYEAFCNPAKAVHEVRDITVQELEQMIANKEPHLLIDVREPMEHQMLNIGGELIPMNSIPDKLDYLKATSEQVIFYCKVGQRSFAVVDYVQRQLAAENFYNLKGGISAWINEIGMPER